MCMTVKYPQNRVMQLPKEFIAYKVVKKRDGKYYPPIQDTLTAIEKHNVSRTMTRVLRPPDGGKYKPYYHSFRTQAACDAVYAEMDESNSWAFIKIRIKRKDVTCVGGVGARGKTQYLTIISKKYSTDFEEYIPNGGMTK